ncbi:hypothetical protein BDV95DRAFT_132898 [Massariosphaeria phaeospora]|uniref:Uncharacterized protein n=1 Tax=Massariosphaeria phaeospora TaxID=100035 RepID=A0A7C8MWW2_9PLEO|nr:hypothetical protein BDV95DRAFT_132898 [Massariosphaeria phaeospora]
MSSLGAFQSTVAILIGASPPFVHTLPVVFLSANSHSTVANQRWNRYLKRMFSDSAYTTSLSKLFSTMDVTC